MSRWTSALVVLSTVAAIAGGWVALRGPRNAAEPTPITGAQLGTEDSEGDVHEPLSVSPESQRLVIKDRTQENGATSTLPLAVSGVVVDAQGSPYEGAFLQAGRPDFDSIFDAMPDSPDAGVPILQSRSDSLGRFELRGAFSSDSIEVRAEHPDGVDVASQRTSIGTTDLRLVLERGGRIEGSLLLDEGAPRHGVSVSLTRQADDMTVAHLGWNEHGGHFSSGEVAVESGRDLTFAFCGLRAGAYTARVATQYAPKFLVEVVGIEARLGATSRDPRLNPVDLRGRMRSFEIRVIDEQGAAVPNGFASWGQHTEERPPPRIAFTGGRFSVITTDPVVDIEVGATGFQMVRLAQVDGPREIVLGRAIPVNCVLRGAVVPEGPAKLRVALVPNEGPVKLRLGAGSAMIVNLEDVDARQMEQLRVQSNCSYFDGADLDPSGAATLSVPKPGLYQVHWYIASPPSPEGEVTVKSLGETPQWVSIQGGTIQPTLELHLDPGLLSTASRPR